MSRNLPKYPTKEELEGAAYAPGRLTSKWTKARLAAHSHAERADRLAQQIAELEKDAAASAPTKIEMERAAFVTATSSSSMFREKQIRGYDNPNAEVVRKVKAYRETLAQAELLKHQLATVEAQFGTAVSQAEQLDSEIQRETAISEAKRKADAAVEAARIAQYAPTRTYAGPPEPRGSTSSPLDRGGSR